MLRAPSSRSAPPAESPSRLPGRAVESSDTLPPPPPPPRPAPPRGRPARQQQARRAHEGAGNGQHLLLAATQRAGELLPPVSQNGKPGELLLQILANAGPVSPQAGADF